MDDDDNTNLFNDCDWSELHEDILELILKEFSTVVDYLRFGSVCFSWRSVLVPHLHPDLLNPQLPLLMIPSLPWPHYPPPPPPPPLPVPTVPSKLQKYNHRKEEETRSFYNLFDRRVYDDFHVKLPYNMKCCGSSHGWIIASGNVDNDFCVELFNPFISVNNEYRKIQLPPLTAFPYDPDTEYFGDHFLEKAILSANPTITTEYVVMAIYSGLGKLGFWKPGDQVWTDIPLGWKEDTYDSIDDLIYDHNSGLFYFVNLHGEVMTCDLNGCESCDGNADDHEPPKVRRLAQSPLPAHWAGAPKKYMVESEGDLIMVQRFDNSDGTEAFLVFKLLKEGDKEEEVIKSCAKEWKWKYMETLPGRMLFLGDNASMSLVGSQFPGGKSSCIYFTDDREEKRFDGYRNIGIYNMEDKTIEKLNPMGSNKYMSPANTIWVEPTLKCCLQFKHHI